MSEIEMRECVIGIDIGGTKIAAARVDRQGNLSDKQNVPTPAQAGPAVMIRTITDIISRLVSADTSVPIRGIGIGTAGVVDNSGRRIVAATDAIKDWGGTELAEEIEHAIKLPVKCVNDVNAHALGEYWMGAAMGRKNVLMAAVGTGVGGSVIADGKLLLGSTGVGGDLGHVLTPFHTERVCTCGVKAAHLELVASGPNLHQWYLERGGSPKVVGAKEIEQLAVSGDPLAAQVYQDAGIALGQVLCNLTNVLDPQVVIVGGGLARAGEIWWNPLRKAYRAGLVPWLRDVALQQASLGNEAALVGAGYLAWQME